jgi:dephospho-CoA kinase
MSLEVGLTGGLATGKGFVASVFRELGCHVIDADKLGHEVLHWNGAAYAPVVARFGAGILDRDGGIDRRKLALLVFHDDTQLNELSAIVHPAVERLRQARVREIVARDPDAIIICEAAIYFETGAWRRFARNILTVCGRELQIERAMARSHWTREEAEARMSRQWPDEAKRKLADYVIDTSVSFDDTRRQVLEVYNQFKAI